MKKKQKNVLGELLGDFKKRKTKFQINAEELTKYFEFERVVNDVISIFKEHFDSNIDKDFQYISNSKGLKESIIPIKKLLFEDAWYKFSKSNDFKTFVKQYVCIKDKPYFDFNIYKEISEIYFRDWLKEYLKPIQIVLILFFKKNIRIKEFEKFGLKREIKKKGRQSKYDIIFSSVEMLKTWIEKVTGNKLSVTEIIRILCKDYNIPFKSSTISAYSNYKKSKK